MIKGDIDNAIAECGVAVKLVPTYTYALHDLAWAYYEKYKSTTKVKELRNLLETLKQLYALEENPMAQK